MGKIVLSPSASYIKCSLYITVTLLYKVLHYLHTCVYSTSEWLHIYQLIISSLGRWSTLHNLANTAESHGLWRRQAQDGPCSANALRWRIQQAIHFSLESKKSVAGLFIYPQRCNVGLFHFLRWPHSTFPESLVCDHLRSFTFANCTSDSFRVSPVCLPCLAWATYQKVAI